MPYILSLDTSTITCSVALHKNGNLIVCEEIYRDKSHSEYLALCIKNLLASIDFDMKDLDAVAISKGPGSYTGLRIGTATAKGLCYALDIPLISVNTLQSMAYEVSQFNVSQAHLCPMIDARRMEVYCLMMDAATKLLEPTQAKIIEEDSFQGYLLEHQVIFFGNGAAKCHGLLAQSKNALFIQGVNPSAKYVGALAWERFQAKQFE